MAIVNSFKNGSKAESAANTMTYDNVEIPDSIGAKRVFIIRAEIDVDQPEYVAASNTFTMGIVQAGKLSPSAATINEPGAITSKTFMKLSTGAANFAAIVEGPDQAQGRWEVYKAPNDNKYYFTVGIKGLARTAAGVITYRVDFEIEI